MSANRQGLLHCSCEIARGLALRRTPRRQECVTGRKLLPLKNDGVTPLPRAKARNTPPIPICLVAPRIKDPVVGFHKGLSRKDVLQPGKSSNETEVMLEWLPIGRKDHAEVTAGFKNTVAFL